MPPTNGGPHNRLSSPQGGGSTLITSAPISASIIVHIGPERIRDRSTTTRSSSGRMDGNDNRCRIRARALDSPCCKISILSAHSCHKRLKVLACDSENVYHFSGLGRWRPNC